MYPMFSIWVRSHSDLPLKIYQIVNTFRYETKQTRPLIRCREITSFKEAHTAHATYAEAEQQIQDAIIIYSEFFTKLSVPFIINKRPDWDKFPGADYTMAFDALMPNGKTLQIGTVHNLGTKFAKTYEITYEDDKGVFRKTGIDSPDSLLDSDRDARHFGGRSREREERRLLCIEGRLLLSKRKHVEPK